MHTGRSHHSITEIVGSTIGGFGISFLVLTGQVMLQSSKNLQGQLLAGDGTADSPAMINTVSPLGDGNTLVMQAMGSYAWWIVVIVGGVIASFALMHIMRKYV